MNLADDKIRGLVIRELQESPELRDPAPLTSETVALYRQRLSQMTYQQLVRERDLVQQTYDLVADALPEWRVDLSLYPHPVVQRRLLVMNELYKRAEVNPEMAYSYHKNIAMIEWGAAGAVVGGLIGYFAKDRLWTGVISGGVLGAVAGRSALLQNILMNISSRAVMI